MERRIFLGSWNGMYIVGGKKEVKEKMRNGSCGREKPDRKIFLGLRNAVGGTEAASAGQEWKKK